MKAVATDSLSDTAATTVVLLASIFTHFTGIKIDGYCGLVAVSYTHLTFTNKAADEIKERLYALEPEITEEQLSLIHI